MSEVSSALAILAFAVFGIIGCVLAAIDIRTHRLPNRIVGVAAAAGLALLTASAVTGGRLDQWIRALLGAGALFAAYLVLRMLSRAGIGGGDVKLAGVVGLHLGWLGWGALLVGSAAAFLLGGVAAAILVLTGRVNVRAGIPFGPWMLAGAWVGIVVAMSRP